MAIYTVNTQGSVGDLSLKPTALFEFEYEVVAGSYTAYFDDNTTPTNIHLASFEVVNSNGLVRWINYKVHNGQVSTHIIDENTIRYNGVYPGIDIKYEALEDRIKEYIYVDSLEHYKDIVFTITSEGCIYKEEEGSINFYDVDTNEKLWAIEKPFVMGQDANVSIYESGQIDRYQTFTVAIQEPESLLYPLVIDPTTYTINSVGSSSTNFPSSIVEGDKLIFNVTSTTTGTGYYRSWTIPEDGTYLFDLYGAAGGPGGSTSYPSLGGDGGHAAGQLELTQGTVVYFYVGQMGMKAYSSALSYGGWNGGGYSYGWGNNNTSNPGTGGGASDIRIGGTALSNRILVAGGGGGAGSGYTDTLSNGGDGGGLTGASVSEGGSGGTQSAGGYSGGALGAGGNGTKSKGAGGGGYYGGGASTTDGKGGGGGSSYIGHPSLIVGTTSTTAGVRTSHGKIEVTVVSLGPSYVSDDSLITTTERIIDQGTSTLPMSEKIIIDGFANLPSNENVKLPGIPGDSSIAANENVYGSEESTVATTELIKEQGLDNIDATERVLTGPESATIDTTERVTYGGSSNLTLRQRIKGVASSNIDAPEKVYVPEIRKTSIGYGQWTDLQNSAYVYKDLAIEGVPSVNTYNTFTGTIPGYYGTARVSQSYNNPLYKCTSIVVYPYTTAPKAPYLKVELREIDNNNNGASRTLFSTIVANSGSSIAIDTSSSLEFNAEGEPWQYSINVYVAGIEVGGSISSNYGILMDSSGSPKCTIKGYMVGRATSSTTDWPGSANTPWISKPAKDAMVKFTMVGPSINPNVNYVLDTGSGMQVFPGQYFKVPASATSYRILQSLSYEYNSYSLVSRMDIEEAYVADIVRLTTNENVIANESSSIPVTENIANGTGSDILATTEYVLPFSYQTINTVEKVYGQGISSLSVSEKVAIDGASSLSTSERITRPGINYLSIKENVEAEGTSILPMTIRVSGPESISLPINERIILVGSSLLITTERVKRSGTDSLSLTERSIRSNKKYLTINERPINSTSSSLPVRERSIYTGTSTLDMNEAVGTTGITSLTMSEKAQASSLSSISMSERTTASDISIIDMKEYVRLDGNASIDITEKVIISSSSTIRLKERISADTVSFITAHEFIDGDNISILHMNEYISDESINLQVRKSLYRRITQ